MIKNLANTERILIVDDLAPFRKFISGILTDKGYNCVGVADGVGESGSKQARDMYERALQNRTRAAEPTIVGGGSPGRIP